MSVLFVLRLMCKFLLKIRFNMSTDPSLNVTGLILARGGSVGIPLKNIKILNGLPLIAWVLRAANDWSRFNEIWVSTDNEQIAKECVKYGAKIHHRPSSLSGCEVSSLACVLDFVKCHPECRILVLLQATSPFLHPIYLQMALEMIMFGNYDSVFSVTRDHKLRWKVVQNGEATIPMNFDPKNRPRRQDWSGELIENGMFYMSKIDYIFEGSLQGGRCGYVEVKKEHSLDIDSKFDWDLAEFLIKKHGYKGSNKN